MNRFEKTPVTVQPIVNYEPSAHPTPHAQKESKNSCIQLQVCFESYKVTTIMYLNKDLVQNKMLSSWEL